MSEKPLNEEEKIIEANQSAGSMSPEELDDATKQYTVEDSETETPPQTNAYRPGMSEKEESEAFMRLGSNEERMQFDRDRGMDSEKFWYRYGSTNLDFDQIRELMKFRDIPRAVMEVFSGSKTHEPDSFVNLSASEQEELAKMVLLNNMRSAIKVGATEQDIQATIARANLSMGDAIKVMQEAAEIFTKEAEERKQDEDNQEA